MRQRSIRRALYALPVQVHLRLIGAQGGAFVRELAVLIPVV